MSHHKRHRPKHQRAGCLYCKTWKDERVKGAAESQPVPVQRALQDDALRDVQAALDAEPHPAELAAETVDGYCDQIGCPECGGLGAQHIEHEGPLRVPLLDLARVA